MSEYLKDIKEICEQLASIGKPVDEKMKIFAALHGLGREYEPIKTSIEGSMDNLPNPTFEDVIPRLTGYEDRLTSYNGDTDVTPHMAFSTVRSEGNYNNNNRGRGYSRGNRGRGAFSTRGRGFHQQISPGSTFSSSGNTYGTDNRIVCQICGKQGHPALKCWHRFNNSYQYEELPSALTAMRITDVTEHGGQEWYPDTGASAHVTSSPHHLQQAHIYQGSDTVMIGDGNFLPITHTGSASIASSSGTLPLKDVLVCPTIAKSLLSVSKLTRDYPCTFEFDCDAVRVNDKETKRLLTLGRNHNGLYVLEDSPLQAFYSTRQHCASDEVWHMRLGHPHSKILQYLSSTKAITIINKSIKKICEACQLGKSSRLPFSDSVFVASRPLERIHCDLWGPSPIMSVQGFRYYVVFIDNYSRFSWFYPLKLKSDFLHAFICFQALVENQFQTKIGSFQSDGGGEFTSSTFQKTLQTKGIRHLMSCPHTPQQNGLAERKHRHLTELGLSMMFQAKMPQKYWVEAFYTANFLSNLLPSSVFEHYCSPYEMLHKQTPDYTSLRVFGCACYPTLRDYATHKFDPRSLKCVFLGYNDKYKGYRCLLPETGRVYISRHVLFDEGNFPFSTLQQSGQQNKATPLTAAWQQSFFTPQQNQPSQVRDKETNTASMDSSTNSQHFPTTQPLQLQRLDPRLSNTNEEQSSECTAGFDPDPIGNSSNPSTSISDSSVSATTDSATQQTESTTEDQSQSPNAISTGVSHHPMLTRAKAGIRKPNPRYALLTHRVKYQEPKTVREALKHEGWNKAMHEEIGNCSETQTWSLVPHTPNMHVLGSKWVFRTKLHADGSLNKLKARLVAKGFNQEECIDYLETYSPVVRTATIRVVLHIATIMQWDIKQMDVQNAFLHGDLTETVYMKQPAGFIDKSKPDHVCHLHKSLYGLKQSPRAWFDKFSDYLLEFGFLCSNRDPSLFIYIKEKDIIMLLLYVDDMVITGNSSAVLSKLLNGLNIEFRMKDLGKFEYFLGIQAQYHSKGLFLSQQKYAEDLLAVAGMEECNPVSTPLPLQLNNKLSTESKEEKQGETEEELFDNPTYFRSLAGKLQYLTLTRPDIQFAVNFVCQKMHAPTVSDFNLLRRILRYIRGTATMGISFNKDTDCKLRAYSDSDWAGCGQTRRLTGGYCTFLGTNLISWCSRKHQTISRSSTEAEYRTLSDTASEITWIGFLLNELGIPLLSTPELYCDNLSAVYLTANPAFHARTKHFELDHHYVRERVALRALVVNHISSQLQIADIFTKSLPTKPFTELRFKLGVDVPPTPSLRGAIRNPNPTAAPSSPIISARQQTKETVKMKPNIQTMKPSAARPIKQTMKPTKIRPANNSNNKENQRKERTNSDKAVAKGDSPSCHQSSRTAMTTKTGNRFDPLSNVPCT